MNEKVRVTLIMYSFGEYSYLPGSRKNQKNQYNVIDIKRREC